MGDIAPEALARSGGDGGGDGDIAPEPLARGGGDGGGDGFGRCSTTTSLSLYDILETGSPPLSCALAILMGELERRSCWRG